MLNYRGGAASSVSTGAAGTLPHAIQNATEIKQACGAFKKLIRRRSHGFRFVCSAQQEGGYLIQDKDSTGPK